MASLNSMYIKTDVLEKILQTLKKKGEKGIEITISINDEANDYGQNLSAFVSQTKEQREEKKPRFYVGNGKTFWTDGTIKVPEKEQQPVEVEAEVIDDEDDDLPF